MNAPIVFKFFALITDTLNKLSSFDKIRLTLQVWRHESNEQLPAVTYCTVSSSV
jgi:hypothetical protein